MLLLTIIGSCHPNKSWHKWISLMGHFQIGSWPYHLSQNCQINHYAGGFLLLGCHLLFRCPILHYIWLLSHSHGSLCLINIVDHNYLSCLLELILYYLFMMTHAPCYLACSAMASAGSGTYFYELILMYFFRTMMRSIFISTLMSSNSLFADRWSLLVDLLKCWENNLAIGLEFNIYGLKSLCCKLQLCCLMVILFGYNRRGVHHTSHPINLQAFQVLFVGLSTGLEEIMYLYRHQHALRFHSPRKKCLCFLYWVMIIIILKWKQARVGGTTRKEKVLFLNLNAPM